MLLQDAHVLELRSILHEPRDQQGFVSHIVGHSHKRQLTRNPGPQKHQPGQRDKLQTVNNAFVSFYFTNVPLDITYVELRQGFEVCGLMEDVYLAR